MCLRKIAVLAAVVLDVAVLAMPAAHAAYDCQTVYSIKEQQQVGALQFDVDYTAADGYFVSEFGSPSCFVFVSNLYGAVEDDEDLRVLHVTAVGKDPLPGQTIFMKCKFYAPSLPTAAQFPVTVVDSPPTNPVGITSNVCGAPATGANPPFATDAAVIIRTAVGHQTGCQACECDVDKNGIIDVFDAYRVANKSVQPDVQVLTCDPCGGAPGSAPPTPTVDVEVSLECEEIVCGDGDRGVDEECDDGNLENGDCCSELCKVEPDGTVCSDSNTCTADHCESGDCESTSIDNCPLVPKDHEAGDEFGRALAMTRSHLVVGAPASKSSGAGRVHVFASTDDGYVEQIQEKPVPVPFRDQDEVGGAIDFGSSVDIDGTTIVAGAPFDVVSAGDGQSHGSASVFFHDGTSWVRQAKLLDTSGECGMLGADVAISGDTIVLGAPGGDCALVFERTGSAWAAVARLAPDEEGSRFGAAVDVSGDAILVGAPGKAVKNACSGNGSVRAFRRSGGEWNPEDTIEEPAETGGGSCFGAAVGVDGASAVIGAPYDDSAGSDSGAAYIVERGEPSWEIAEQLLAFASVQDGGAFGSSVDMHGDLLIVGAPGVASYVFRAVEPISLVDADSSRIVSKWGAERVYVPPSESPAELSKFGTSVAVDSSTAATGAPDEDPDELEDAGVVYPADFAPASAFVCGDANVTTGEDCDDGDAVWKPGEHCDATCAAVLCGDPNDSGTYTTFDALFALRTAVKIANCDLLVCDVNKSGTITTSDALQILKKAVGVGVNLKCS